MSRIGLFGQISEVTEHLYLSGAGVLKPEKLKQKQITCIINATIEEPNAYIPGIDYLKISIEDNPVARIDQYFDFVADKIKAIKDRGGKTLVHCVAGVSRSASLCIIYLVKYERMSLRQAYHYVKSARPIIRPNVGFWKQMIDYERKIRGASSVSMITSNQCDLAIPDVYCSELKKRIVQNKSNPKHITTGLISMQSLFSGRSSLPSSLSTMTYRRSGSPTAISSSFVPSFPSRYSSVSLLNPAPTRRRGSSSLFENLYHSEFSAF
ncbi:unnamed protein product [Anisakis simplex]|uniref:Dual specificity protein phosphatase 14 n=1 Tax=Anisakis simplex TaxID=6269 RepID=A0A0M3JUH0_ANISI|nr:unnamed protein product [Anisakis simplex]